MLTTRSVVSMFSMAMIVLGAGVVSGQDYPNKPIRIVTASVGAGNDFISRVVAQAISGPLGQQFIIDNQTAVMQSEIVFKAPPDGYTLLITGAPFWMTPLLRTTPYDVMRDFSLISLLERSPAFLVMHPALPVKSVKELIALAKARPGELNYASGSVGGIAHLSVELFNNMAGVKIVRIPYKSDAVQMADLIAGEVQLAVGGAVSVMPSVKAGRLKALATTSMQPSMMFPEVPTIAASGLPGYDAQLLVGMFAPSKTPVAIINRLNHEAVQALNRADVKEKFLTRGIEPAGTSPSEFVAILKSEISKWDKLIKATGIKAD